MTSKTSSWPCHLSREAFLAHVEEAGIRHHRMFPWRYINDPYGVLVSEVMLQQTQVSRVEKFWPRFIDLFPTIDVLAWASQADVLTQWQGLGYNRRALALHKTAQICSQQFAGSLPRTYDELIKLPGIGPATAAGIMAFAYNEAAVYIETNVRAVFIHELFPDEEKISDRRLAPLVEQTCPPGVMADFDDAPQEGQPISIEPLRSPRGWYYALLDYGAYLKSTGINPTRRAAQYTRQSAFEGSRRQKRSWLVKRVLDSPEGIACDQLIEELQDFERTHKRDDVDETELHSIIDELVAEGFFTRCGTFLVL